MKNYATILVAGAMATATAHAGSVVDDGIGLQQSGGNSGFMNLSDDSLPMLAKGTQELGIGGDLDLNDGVAWDLNFSYGYFLADNWEVGFSIDWAGEDSDILQNSAFGLFTEYNFATGTKWVPYIGAGVSYAASGDKFDPTPGSTGTIDGVEGVAFNGELGIKYFIRSHMAVYAGASFSWSPDDVFGVAEEIEDSVTNLEVGMRFYF